MPNASSAVVKKPLWNWVFSHNQWHQVLLLIAAVAAVGANLLPLEMQKRIVNEAIDQQKRDLLIGYCGICLAALSFSIYPAVLLIVPLLQRRVNDYNKGRVDTTRRMSGKASESIAGLHEIHANNTYALEGDKFERIIQRLRRIRILWVLYRYAVKRINSLFTNFSRFLVFFIGGYLAIRGQLQLGALVASLSAQDKLCDPWKELIAFYQAYQTARVTYKQTMSYFDMRAAPPLVPEDRKAKRLGGAIKVEDVDCVTDDGVQMKGGTIVELGSHDELMDRKSFLYDLVNRPAEGGKWKIP